MENIFSILAASRQANSQAMDSAGRQLAPIRAIVSSNDDPEGDRRVRVTDPACPELETNWLRRMVSCPGLDAPLPPIGSSVVVHFVDGDPTDGVYTPIMNDTNPPLGKDDPIRDHYESVPGDRVSSTGKARRETVEETYTIKVGVSFRLENAIGAYIELAASGQVIISDSFGHKLTLGAGGLNNLLEWDMAGANVQFKNCGDMQISQTSSGFKTIATVTAPDSHGDTLTGAGWK